MFNDGRVAAVAASVLVMVAVASTSAEASTADTDPSPAGCHLTGVANPHFAQSVPGAVKVNVKAQCSRAVPEQTLTVTMLVDGRPFHRTTTKANNKPFLWNQDTFVVCRNFEDSHSFQGAALGVSWEGDRPYLQAQQGPVVTIRCGI